ncbi:MAG: glycosyltransferase family 61 protein [Bacteroidetes bacterium]|jgi:hypothetical protein|nr:glycosyltransferase family 61 protein [Bacteroidota bacterium]
MKKHKDLDKYLQFQRKKYFIKSFFRKAKRLIVDFVPLQNIPNEYCEEKIVVRTEQTSIVETPKTFIAPSLEIIIQLNPVIIYGLKNVFVASETTSFLTKNLKTTYYEEVEKFSKEYTLMYNSNNLLFHSEKLAKLNNLPKKYVDREVLFLTGNFSFNYFHFLIEILTKIEFVQSIPNFENLLVVVHHKIGEIGNMKSLLSFFVPNNEILFLSEDFYYQFRKTWHISYPSVVIPNIGEGDFCKAEFSKISQQSVSFVRNTCLSNMDTKQVKIEPISKIFLARKTEFRKYNEPELLAVAEKFGFQPVYLEDYTIHEQIYLMQHSEYIVGPSGAAWTNLIFCQPGKTKGLLWLANVWKEFSLFSTLANYSGVDLYNWRFGDDSLGFHEDYVLDTSEFEQQLIQLLAK